ncbi:MAG: hypothetical protein AABY97_00045 [Chloroflexota bacterium]
MLGYRVGSALILLGIIVLSVFLLGLSIEQGDFGLLLAGAGLCLFGLILRRNNARRSAAGPARFQSLRHFLGEAEDEESQPNGD